MLKAGSKWLFYRLISMVMLGLIMPVYGQTQQTVNQDKPPNNKNVSSTQPTDPLLNDDYWIGSLHETIADTVYQSAAWFDNFFSDDNSMQERPETNARIQLSWKPKSSDLTEFDTRFRIKVKLPHFQNKVDVILSDDDETEQDQLPLESHHINPDQENSNFSAAVRYIHKQSHERITDTRLGISGGDIFIRARHKRHFAWSASQGFKIEPSLFYFLKDGLGERLLLEYDYQHSPQTQYRINYSINGSESFSGIHWKHGFYKLNQIDTNTATVIGLQIQGERNGDRGFFIDKYTLSYRYRFNALKQWLYFEVEPFLEWTEEENYQTTPGIALRVEGFFYKG